MNDHGLHGSPIPAHARESACRMGGPISKPSSRSWRPVDLAGPKAGGCWSRSRRRHCHTERKFTLFPAPTPRGLFPAPGSSLATSRSFAVLGSASVVDHSALA